MQKQKRSRFRMHVRHYCDRCGSRVFPFDKYEARTEMPGSPEHNSNPHRVLLYSANTKDVENRTAWCWACGGFTRAKRLDEEAILRLYLARKGVVTRKPGKNN